MVTTDNEVQNSNTEQKDSVTKDDAKKMRDEYVKGSTIDDLAETYGYTSLQVNEVVVTEVPAPTENQTQAEIDAAPTKKGK